MGKRRLWTRDEQLIALRLYIYTDFGKLHNRNPEIIRLAELIGRTPDALGMKACNFASLDPAQQARGVKGLKARSKADEQLWTEFEEDAESIAAEAEAAYDRFTAVPPPCQGGPGGVATKDARSTEVPANLTEPPGPTETERTVRTRRVQSFFRQAVLVSYENQCALTGLAVPTLLTASHIIPWSQNERRRADPRNGLCLNPLHDRAFDRGLLTFDEDLRAVVSPRLKTKDPPPLHAEFLVGIEGERLRLPVRFEPDLGALEWHRREVYRDL